MRSASALSVQHALDFPEQLNFTTVSKEVYRFRRPRQRSRSESIDDEFRREASGLTNAVAASPEKIEAEWKPRVEALIEELSALQAGWDLAAALPIDREIMKHAKRLVAVLAAPGTPAPSVVPTINGTVQLEWHTLRCDAEVEVLADNEYQLFTMLVGEPAWEGTVEQEEAVVRLQQLIAE